jgi:hypothetical protein
MKPQTVLRQYTPALFPYATHHNAIGRVRTFLVDAMAGPAP